MSYSQTLGNFINATKHARTLITAQNNNNNNKQTIKPQTKLNN